MFKKINIIVALYWGKVKIIRILMIGAVCLTSMLICGCGATPLGTRGADAADTNATQLVLTMDNIKDNGCKRRNIVNKQSIGTRKDTHSRNEEIEIWTVDRCGILVNYRVTATTVAGGEKQFMVEAEK